MQHHIEPKWRYSVYTVYCVYDIHIFQEDARPVSVCVYDSTRTSNNVSFLHWVHICTLCCRKRISMDVHTHHMDWTYRVAVLRTNASMPLSCMDDIYRKRRNRPYVVGVGRMVDAYNWTTCVCAQIVTPGVLILIECL